MKRALLFLSAVVAGLVCASCAALPGEERSFAVAVGVSGGEGAWTLHARVPAYRSAGEYLTISGTGDTLPHALADLDAAAPMQLHPGQARLVIISARTLQSGAFPRVLAWLADWPELRTGACLAATPDDMAALMDALNPVAGTRLSKSLDVLLETRLQQGVVPDSPVAEVLRMGERQSPVLIAAALTGEAVTLSGGWPVGADGRSAEALSAREMQLLSLMQGRLRQGMLALPEGIVRLTDASAAVSLSLPTMQAASVRLILQTASSPLTGDALSRTVASACLSLLSRLSDQGCDALGLGREAVRHVADMEEWHDLQWPARLRAMEWAVSVGAE